MSLRRPGSARTRHRSEISERAAGGGDLLTARPRAARPSTGGQGGSTCLAPRHPARQGLHPRREEITTEEPARQGTNSRSPGSLSFSLIQPGPSASARWPTRSGTPSEHRSDPARTADSGIGKSVGQQLASSTGHAEQQPSITTVTRLVERPGADRLRGCFRFRVIFVVARFVARNSVGAMPSAEHCDHLDVGGCTR
jgi:hypothetical protein